MKTLNYKAEFAQKVEDGTKRQTIRKTRRIPFVVGDELRHYTGMRTKHCHTLRDSVCTQVRSVSIADLHTISLDGKLLTRSQIHTLALADGFKGPGAMISWFADVHGLPFQGQVINW